MYLRRCRSTKCKKAHIYWELVESYRTERGPRQRVVAYLGDVSEGKRLGVQQAARGATGSWQSRLFDEEGEPEWVEEVDGEVVAGWYEQHGASGDWSHNGSIELETGWHKYIYRHEESTGAQAARAAFKYPGDASWRPFSTSELPIRIHCADWTGTGCPTR